MTDSELIQNCRNIIGPSHEDDWIIRPQEHADTFAESAPELSEVLREARLEERAAEFQRADQSAIEEQVCFKKLARSAAWSVFFVVLCSALLMAVSTLFGGTMSTVAKVSTTILGILALTAGPFGTYSLNRLRDADPLAAWYKKRAAAEKCRLDYFKQLVEPFGRGSNRRLNLLKLEYLRRFLLDSQKAFYDKRSGEHLAGLRKGGSLAAIATAIATGATGLAGLLAANVDPHWAALSALAVVATAYVALSKSIERIDQNRSNAHQYEETRTLIGQLSMENLDRVRLLAGGSDAEPLTTYFSAAEKILMDEHSSWLEGQTARAKVISDLSQELKKQESKEEENTESGAEGDADAPLPASDENV